MQVIWKSICLPLKRYFRLFLFAFRSSKCYDMWGPSDLPHAYFSSPGLSLTTSLHWNLLRLSFGVFLAAPQGMKILSSLTRDRTPVLSSVSEESSPLDLRQVPYLMFSECTKFSVLYFCICSYFCLKQWFSQSVFTQNSTQNQHHLETFWKHKFLNPT